MEICARESKSEPDGANVRKLPGFDVVSPPFASSVGFAFFEVKSRLPGLTARQAPDGFAG